MASGIRRSGKPIIDIGEAFFPGKNIKAVSERTARSAPWKPSWLTARPTSGRQRRGGLLFPSGFLLGLQNLAALVHAGFQIEVVRTAQFAGILVLGIGRLLERVRRAAHATPRGRCFSSGNGHNGPLGMLSEASSGCGPPCASSAGCDADKVALIEDGMA